MRKADEALTFHVAGMVEDGDRLPFLRSQEELWADHAFVEAMRVGALFIARFETPSKSVRINISIDENLLADVDKAAAATGQSRSAFLAHAARDRIRA